MVGSKLTLEVMKKIGNLGGLNLKLTPFSVDNEKKKKGLGHFFLIFENIFGGCKKLG